MLVAERALAGGRQVLMIERGTALTHQQRFAQRSHNDPLPFNGTPVRMRQTDWDYVFRPTYNLGGSTNHFYGNMPRIHPAHFDGEAFGGANRRWPIRYAELEPYYLQAEERLKISGNSEATPFPGRFAYPLPPHRPSPHDRACAQIFGEEHVTQVPTVRPSRDVDGRPRCCSSNRCALCPIDSKGTALNMVYPAIHDRIDLRSGLLATEIHCQGGRVESVTAVDAKGNTHRIVANQFIIACNGVDSCLLLQRSPDVPKHASLGRHYMDHPSFNVAIYGTGLDARPGYGDSAQTGMMSAFYERLASDLPVSVFCEIKCGELAKEEGSPTRDGVLRDLLKLSIEQRYSKAPDFRSRFTENWRSTLLLVFVVELQPKPENTVAIRRIDRNGAAIPQITIAYPDYMDEAIARVMKSIEQRLKQGEAKVLSRRLDAQHWMGSTRMADSPAEGCVDRNLRYHDLENLYVLSGSVYPSASTAHPTLTISAFALRLGDHLAPSRPTPS